MERRADGNEVSVVESTIADNTTKEETGGPARGPGAGLLVSDGTADVTSSIFAFNEEINEIGNFTATNCSTSGSATIVSHGYNLESLTDCGFQSTGDVQETFPGFTSSEPQNNGGNTDTLGLEPTSPGVDAIPAGPLCNGSDQRGVTRPQGIGCDIGAFELGAVHDSGLKGLSSPARSRPVPVAASKPGSRPRSNVVTVRPPRGQ